MNETDKGLIDWRTGTTTVAAMLVGGGILAMFGIWRGQGIAEAQLTALTAQLKEVKEDIGELDKKLAVLDSQVGELATRESLAATQKNADVRFSGIDGKFDRVFEHLKQLDGDIRELRRETRDRDITTQAGNLNEETLVIDEDFLFKWKLKTPIEPGDFIEAAGIWDGANISTMTVTVDETGKWCFLKLGTDSPAELKKEIKTGIPAKVVITTAAKEGTILPPLPDN